VITALATDAKPSAGDYGGCLIGCSASIGKLEAKAANSVVAINGDGPPAIIKAS
jgi:hypothetical protein